MDKQKPKSIIEIIKEAGYVMVVRCRDCKYWTVGDFGPFCPYHHDAKPDWFCADGIAKDTDYDPIWD